MRVGTIQCNRESKYQKATVIRRLISRLPFCAEIIRHGVDGGEKVSRKCRSTIRTCAYFLSGSYFI